MLSELLIMMGLHGISHGINAFDEDVETNEWGVYRDGNGDYRIRPSLRKVFYGHTHDGECVYFYKNGTVAVNIDLELSKQREQEAKEKGYKFYQRTGWGGRIGNEHIKTARYCKVGEDNSICYVKRMAEYKDNKNNISYMGTFYMDMNYNFVAPTDETIEKDIKYRGKPETELYQIIINEFNKREVRNHYYMDLTFCCGDSHLSDYSIPRIRKGL